MKIKLICLFASVATCQLAGQSLDITSTGVGIGTSSPVTKLDVNGNIQTEGSQIAIVNSGTPELYLAKLGTRGWSLRNDGAFNVFNWEDSSNPFTILNGGNVGIGTTSPGAKLDVRGAIYGASLFINPPSGNDAAVTIAANYVSGASHSGSMAIHGAVIGGNYADYLVFYNDYVGNTSSYYMAMASGNLSFARGGDAYPAFIAGGNGGPLTFRGTTNGNVGSITTDTTATYYNTSSDQRLKTNIRDLTGSGPIIDALRPRLFDWKAGERNSYGFVAQEVYPIFPQAVLKGDDNPDTIVKQWAIDPAKLVPVLTAEIKSLRARVATLETVANDGQGGTVSQLAQQVAELRHELTELKVGHQLSMSAGSP